MKRNVEKCSQVAQDYTAGNMVGVRFEPRQSDPSSVILIIFFFSHLLLARRWMCDQN